MQRAAETAKNSEEVRSSCGFVLHDESSSFCQDVYKPRQDENGTPGGEGFLHYTANGHYVTVASGRGDPEKDCETALCPTSLLQIRSSCHLGSSSLRDRCVEDFLCI